MFEALNERLTGVFDRITGRGALSEKDVAEAMREVRVALLEADVALPVARDFVDKVTEQAIGQNVLRSITPGQQVVKIVRDEMVKMLGQHQSRLRTASEPPTVYMVVGLQGSGKTTSTAKLARLLVKDGFTPLLVSVDIYRPAARKQVTKWVAQAKKLPRIVKY